MATDYASELLGVTPKTETKATDYASDLLNTKPEKAPGLGKPKGLLDGVEIANNDAGVTDKTVASFDTMRKAAMVDDPATKLKIFASSRFPNDPKAIERYGLIDGEPVYLNDDGKVYRESPKGILGWLKGAAAGIAGAPGATAGAIAGGIAGAPGGPAGMAAGAALGAAGGKGYDKVAANLAFDEPQTVEGNAKAMATEGLFAAGGSLIGSGLSKVLNRNVARDIGKFDKAASAELTRKAERIGVELDAAQTTNLPSLKAKADVLAVMPTSRDAMADAAKKRAGQAYKAADDFINGLSPTNGLDEAGEAARGAAKNVIATLTKERADAARPLYESAFAKFDQYRDALARQNPGGQAPVTIPQVSDLLNRPGMRQAVRQAGTLASGDGAQIPANAASSLKGLHYVKLALDDAIEKAGNPVSGTGPTQKRQLVQLKNELLNVMDGLSPDYAEARKVFGHFSPTINAVRDGVVSRLADLSDESIHKAADMVFKGNISPASVGKTRALFVKAGMENDWNTLLASYLRDTFEVAGKGATTPGGGVTQAPKFAMSMTGNPRQYRVLEKAMSPDQFSAFKDMTEVFDAMGRTAWAGQGSQTMPRQEAAAMLRRESGAGVIGQAAGALSPQAIGQRVANWISEVRMGNHAEKVAQVLTSPDGIKRLKELRQLSPRDQKAIAAMSNLFGISLAPEAVSPQEPRQ